MEVEFVRVVNLQHVPYSPNHDPDQPRPQRVFSSFSPVANDSFAGPARFLRYDGLVHLRIRRVATTAAATTAMSSVDKAKGINAGRARRGEEINYPLLLTNR